MERRQPRILLDAAIWLSVWMLQLRIGEDDEEFEVIRMLIIKLEPCLLTLAFEFQRGE